ncbi:MAG TPA: flavodoxin-dependent (E)-4-hydroxy-3-methylbut-2-enyl-diphosphate synthase [bacterium]|nr:flavodoxin-dependent (E)-4-hydroxy-3-methylbut-2-enyl-diphosphate synthase [bacterium]
MQKARTREINLGGLKLGGNNPIRVQSMTNTDTSKFLETWTQVEQLALAGCEIIRIGVKDEKCIDPFIKIQEQTKVPLVADIHFNADLAIECIKRGADGIRINPGNIGSVDTVEKIIQTAKNSKVCIRIGVNSGSLEKELLKKYGHPCPEALAESALNWAKFFEDCGFYNFKLSIKSSNIEEMVKANLLVAEKTTAPLHLGLTEAGTLISGLIRSTLGLSKLLEQGIGDTIRISLSSDPVNEVIAGRELLKSLKLRTGVQVISCPTCTRTEIDVMNIAERLEMEFSNVEVPIKIAVMGCVVNGPGEAKEADIGIAGAKESVALFVNGEVVKKVTIETAYEEIRKYINDKISGGGK